MNKTSLDLLYLSMNENANKYLKFVKSIDIQISRNLKDGGIEMRTSKNNGLWCCLLLPTVMIIYSMLYEVSLLYKLVAFVSVGMIFYSFLFIIFISISCIVLKETVYGGCIASSLIPVLLIYIYLGQDLWFSLCCSILAVYIYSYLLRVSIVSYPKTFTVGEAMIVTQGIVLFFIMISIRLMWDVGEVCEEMELVNIIVYTVLLTVGLMVTAIYLMTDDMKTLKALGNVFICGIIFAMLMLHSLIGIGCIPKILNFIFMINNRAQIIAFWLALLAIAIIVILLRTQMAVKASTVTRKTFHVLASLVFMSGMLFDVYLITLGAGIGLGLLILVEALRKSGIEPISSALQSAFLVYSDEKDAGTFAMTPMYLYAGLACPLLLVPRQADQLQLLAGVLAIGVGDTAASWFGSFYGFNKWTGSNRTYEGTAFNILSQVATVYALDLFELLNAKNAMLRASVAATITGLVEARTDQIDNLILPLVSLLAYQLTYKFA